MKRHVVGKKCIRHYAADRVLANFEDASELPRLWLWEGHTKFYMYRHEPECQWHGYCHLWDVTGLQSPPPQHAPLKIIIWSAYIPPLCHGMLSFCIIIISQSSSCIYSYSFEICRTPIKLVHQWTMKNSVKSFLLPTDSFWGYRRNVKVARLLLAAKQS